MVLLSLMLITGLILFLTSFILENLRTVNFIPRNFRYEFVIDFCKVFAKLSLRRTSIHFPSSQ